MTDQPRLIRLVASLRCQSWEAIGTIIYRWAEDRVDRLPEMASELAQQATVIVTTGGPPAAFAAKAATTTIPIVFLVGEDPARSVVAIGRPVIADVYQRVDMLERRRSFFLDSCG